MLRLVSGLLLVASVALAFNAPALRSRFGTVCTPGTDCFVDIPMNTTQAKTMNWVQPNETLNNAYFQTFCQADNGRICTLFDNKGSIAGYQISLPTAISEQKQPGLDYLEKGFKELTLFGKKWYSNQIWFVEQETILSGGRDFDGTVGTGLWLQAGKDLVAVPDNEKNMPGATPFKRQNCMMRMGQHWFWNTTKDMTQDGFMPWFTLFDKNGEIHGFGFISFGSNVDDLSSTWFENVPARAIVGIAPDTPEWILNYVNTYGIYAHHVYFGENPWNITC